jgi:acyl-CoA thioester hydrolase
MGAVWPVAPEFREKDRRLTQISPQIGVETWRGSVRPRHIDEMGHMNVRYYIANAAEGLVGLAGALGMPRAFTTGASATLAVREHHVRFLHEARVGAGLYMQSAVLEMGESDARLLQVLFHAAGDEPAAAVTTRVEHVTAGEMRPFPWSHTTRRLAEGLTVAAPDYALPRGLVGEPLLGPASAEAADALGLGSAASGALTPSDVDVFGLMRPEHVLERVSQSIPHQLGRADLPLAEHMPELAGHLGGATVELRTAYRRWPRAGDRLVMRSALSGLTPKVSRLTHWMLDPATGQAWTETEMLVVNFDLHARKAVELAPGVLKVLETRLIGPKAP